MKITELLESVEEYTPDLDRWCKRNVSPEWNKRLERMYQTNRVNELRSKTEPSDVSQLTSRQEYFKLRQEYKRLWNTIPAELADGFNDTAMFPDREFHNLQRSDKFTLQDRIQKLKRALFVYKNRRI